VNIRPLARRVSDGILFQFLMVGALSFSHIHDVVAAHGQAGWKSWLYPPSVDLLTVAAYRRILAARRAGRRDGTAWCAFLLGLAASLAANVVDAWAAVPSGLVLAVGIGVWPAVALFVCTLLSHDPAGHDTPAEMPAESAPVPAPVPTATTPVPTAVIAETPSAPTAVVPPRPAGGGPVTNEVATVVPPVALELPPIAAPLLAWARGIADQHRQSTGQPITPDALATRLHIAPALAEAVHGHLIAATAGS
jgi:hypothetical protein